MMEAKAPPPDAAERVARYRRLIDSLGPAVLASMPATIPTGSVFVLAIGREGDGWGYSGAVVTCAELARLIGWPEFRVSLELAAAQARNLGRGHVVTYFATIEDQGVPGYVQAVSLLRQSAAPAAPGGPR